MEWIKKHANSVIVIAGIIVACFWMNTKFSNIEKEIAIMKTVLIMNGHYPKELAMMEEG